MDAKIFQILANTLENTSGRILAKCRQTLLLRTVQVGVAIDFFHLLCQDLNIVTLIARFGKFYLPAEQLLIAQ